MTRQIRSRVQQGRRDRCFLYSGRQIARVRDGIGGPRKHYAKSVNRRDGCQGRDNEPVGVAVRIFKAITL